MGVLEDERRDLTKARYFSWSNVNAAPCHVSLVGLWEGIAHSSPMG